MGHHRNRLHKLEFISVTPKRQVQPSNQWSTHRRGVASCSELKGVPCPCPSYVPWPSLFPRGVFCSLRYPSHVLMHHTCCHMRCSVCLWFSHLTSWFETEFCTSNLKISRRNFILHFNIANAGYHQSYNLQPMKTQFSEVLGICFSIPMETLNAFKQAVGVD